MIPGSSWAVALLVSSYKAKWCPGLEMAAESSSVDIKVGALRGWSFSDLGEMGRVKQQQYPCDLKLCLPNIYQVRVLTKQGRVPFSIPSDGTVQTIVESTRIMTF
jgi:hypothetical protein